nr:hypothetical protein [Aquisphaera giovannonii]
MAIERSFWMAASDRKNWSIGMCGAGRGGRAERVRWPSTIVIPAPGGIT